MANTLRQVMAQKSLSSTARLTYLWIRWTAKRDGFSYATNGYLCDRIGVTEDTITNASRELEAAKLVRRVAGGKGSGVNKRWVILPLLMAAIATGEPVQASSQPIDMFVLQSNLHFAGKKRRGSKRDLTERVPA